MAKKRIQSLSEREREEVAPAKRRRQSLSEREEAAMENKGKEEVPWELTLYQDPWTIKKRLVKSDLDHLCRVILPREQVERQLLQFWGREKCERVESDEGIQVHIMDLDTDSKHVLTFKRWWRSNGSYVFESGWISDFVKRRGLTVGDEIGLLWDKFLGCFYFSILQPDVPPQPVVIRNPFLCEFGRELTLGLGSSKIQRAA